MVIAVTINHNLRTVTNKFNLITTRIPKELGEATHDYAKQAQRNLRLQLTRNLG